VTLRPQRHRDHLHRRHHPAHSQPSTAHSQPSATSQHHQQSHAVDAVLNRAGFDRDSWGADAEAYHAAFLALSKAGTLPDGRTLAHAALDMFADDATWCSDIIRSKGRAPFTYDTAAGLTGPGTPTAVAARKAARAMARAATVPFNRDEEWYEAAGIMVEVMWHAGEAAGLSPLEGRPNCQDHLRHFMDGETPQR
jgi:hypothetical protein